MKITFLSCLLDTGLYHNKVTFSLTPIKGLATKYKTVKWPIAWARRARAIHSLLKICKYLLHQIVRKVIYYFIIYYLYIVFRIWDDTVYDTVASDGWLIDPKWCILLSCFWIRRISCISSMYIEIIIDASEVTIWLGPLANTKSVRLSLSITLLSCSLARDHFFFAYGDILKRIRDQSKKLLKQVSQTLSVGNKRKQFLVIRSWEWLLGRIKLADLWPA